jgi:hypothetical protein
VTAALAVAAIAISLMAIRQTSRHLPRPLIEVKAWYRRDGDNDWVMLSIVNQGNAVAQDLWVWLYHSDNAKSRLPLEHGLTMAPTERRESKSGPTGKLRKERFRVTWRQAPNMKKLYRTTVRVRRVPKDWKDPVPAPSTD